MTIIFATPKLRYDSYIDFWRLVLAAGYPRCFLDEIDLTKPAVFVTTPWDIATTSSIRAARARAGRAVRGKVVWWALDAEALRVRDPDSLIHDDLPLVDAVWVSDRSLVGLHPLFRHVVLGGHAAFGDPHTAKIYDVSLLGRVHGRRVELRDRIIAQGRSVAPPAYGRRDQEAHVATCRAVVNAHADDDPAYTVAASLRLAVAASYGLPVVSEPLADPWPLAVGRDILVGELAELPQLADRVLLDADLRTRLALGLRSRLVLEHPFDRGVNEAADAVLRGAAA